MNIILIIFIILYIILQGADIYTTNKIIAKGGRELNPVMRWIMEKAGSKWWLYKTGIAILSLGVLLGLTIGYPLVQLYTLGGLIFLYLVIVISNFRQMR